jgi:acetylornithine deacetylase
MSRAKITGQLHKDSIKLLKKLVSIESFSKYEDKTAGVIRAFFNEKNIKTKRKFNNVWAYNKYFDKNKKTILLDSHHDTVKPNSGWTMNPFTPKVRDGKLFGLGSNDAGGCLVSLMSAFLFFYDRDDLKYNLIISASAEEEISGMNGILSILPLLKKIDFAIIGEPTGMQMAVAEKGLIVLDCISQGKTGHAANEEGENAIYNAMRDIEWFRTYRFPKTSEYSGSVKMSVTMVNSGIQHNIIPEECRFTVDIRVNDRYTNEEIIGIIKKNISSSFKPRSLRLRSSSISKQHKLVKAGLSIGLKAYGSPTTSNMSLMRVPSVKIGPGSSSRSHSANEFIYLTEIENGIKTYIELLKLSITINKIKRK